MSNEILGLLGVGAVGAALAIGSVAATSESLDMTTLEANVKTRYAESFAGSPWSYAPPVTGVAFALALALSAAERALMRRPMARAPKGKPLEQTRRADAVAEVRGRLEKCLRDPADVVAGWDELLRGAIHMGASDVHISPSAERIQLTYRVQGELYEVINVSANTHAPLVARIKVLSNMDTTVRTSPQDGRLAMQLDGTSVEARVSTLPTESGERVVLRILRGGRAVPEVEALGFSQAVEPRLFRLLSRAQGLIFVTGPVGSGKTTTLYAALQHIARARAKTTSLVTLEDPIELELPFATQTQISPKAGMTFAGTLRSVLRQDPNVLMVGEIRDPETAEIAMQAGLTGHLILTTVHGQNAAGVFARLIDMGIEPFLLASATIGCLSQRLVRGLCKNCRKPAKPDGGMIDRFNRAGIALGPEETFWEPGSCDRCEGGYSGRLPISELLEVSDPIRTAIQARKPTGEIASLAQAEGMLSILEDGLRRARRGETSLLEVLRVAG